MNHDILLVDQRGTGRSKRHDADVTQYGTRMAMDDVDAVRAALGYRQLDVVGSSYGATAAQVYLKLHPGSVRTLMLAGGTAIDVPIFDRWAVNAQRALDQVSPLHLGPRLPEGVPRLGARVRRAREGVERPPGARHVDPRYRARTGRQMHRGSAGSMPASCWVGVLLDILARVGPETVERFAYDEYLSVWVAH